MMRDGVEEGPVSRRVRRRFCSSLWSSPLWSPFVSSEAHGDEPPETPAMDDRIWALLSPEMFDNILARLPMAQMFQMRTVCRRFRALMQLPSFLSSWTPVAAPEHWLLVFHQQREAPWISMAAYDPRVCHWYNLPVQRPFWRFFLMQGNAWMASDHGLVCIPPMEHTRNKPVEFMQTLVVWNPLTNMSRELPGMSIKGRMRVGLVVNPATKAFVVVAVGLKEESLKVTEVYDSAVGFWKPTHTWPVEWRCFSGPLVHCNGGFHAAAVHETALDQFCLITYDLKQGVWKETCKLPITWELPSLRPWLFEITPRRLFLAAMTFLGPDVGMEPYTLRLWELKQLEDGDDVSVEWILVAAVPQLIIGEMGLDFWFNSHFQCKAIGNNLVCFMAEKDMQGLLYDLTRDEWHWMPRRLEYSFEQILPFEPRLDMLSA